MTDKFIINFNKKYENDFKYIAENKGNHIIKCLKCGKEKSVKGKKIYEKKYICCICDRNERRKKSINRKLPTLDLKTLEENYIFKFQQKYKDKFEYITGYREKCILIKCKKCGKEKQVKGKKIYESRYMTCTCDISERRKKPVYDLNKMEEKFIYKFNLKYGQYFEYINWDKIKYITIRCKKCGEIKKVVKSTALIIKQNISCKKCFNNREGISTKTCIDCGKDFLSFSEQHIRCLDCKTEIEKAKRRYWKRMREVKIKSNGKADNSITLARLIKRDNGICQLCGEKVDINDYFYNNNNYRISGKLHPSIDHIKPLAKGGEHTWDNVQLAHLYCNSTKGSK